jgi:hypothetical protein
VIDMGDDADVPDGVGSVLKREQDLRAHSTARHVAPKLNLSRLLPQSRT